MSLSGFTKALVVAGFSAFSSMASADLIPRHFRATIAQARSASPLRTARFRQISIRIESPIIIKFDLAMNGTIHDEINSGLFPTIDGRRVQFRLHRQGRDRDLDIHPGAGDPAINFFVAKGGNFFNLFSNLGDPLTDDWFTPINRANNDRLGCRICRSTTRAAAGRCRSRRRYCCLARGCLRLASLAGASNTTDGSVFVNDKARFGGLFLWVSRRQLRTQRARNGHLNPVTSGEPGANRP